MTPTLRLQLLSKLIFAFFLTTMFAGISNLHAQPADSLIFNDDFNENSLGTFWQADASWSIQSGTAYNYVDGINGTLKTTLGYSQPSYIIETAATGFTTNYNREFRITFGQADLSADSLYQLRYTAYGGARLTLSRAAGNIYSPEVLDEAAVFPDLNASEWYTFKIARYKSGLIQVYVDRGSGYGTIPFLEAIDSTYKTLGHTGWQVSTESFPEDFYVDWFSALKPAVEKPAIREKPIEDSLIKQVTVKNGKAYAVAKLIPGVKQHIDRNYTITAVPDYLKGASFIQTANDDKLDTSNSFLTFFLKEDAIVYLGYDRRSTISPQWLSQWTFTKDSIGTSDKAGYLYIYSRLIELGERYFPVILGGNLASPARGANINYLVAAVKRPISKQSQAEDALVSGAVVANNHLNYTGTGFVDFINPGNDFIEWTVQVDVPGTYNLGFTFANAGTSDRLLKLTNNGTFVDTLDFSPVSSSWSSWAFLSGPDLFLSPGIHKIRVTATGTSGPNIDELSLTYLSPTPPLPNFSSKTYRRDNINSDKVNQFYKAFPNPFLQSTNIYYTVKQRAKVNLSIYTLKGQKIQILQNGLQEAGNYRAAFDAATLPKGTYIYRLQIGNSMKAGKLLKE